MNVFRMRIIFSVTCMCHGHSAVLQWKILLLINNTIDDCLSLTVIDDCLSLTVIDDCLSLTVIDDCLSLTVIDDCH